jgi:hypothetical protein
VTSYLDVDLVMGPNPSDHPTPGMAIWGWMSSVELAWLAEQAALMNSVVEVGSLRGRSAFALLTGCDGPVYCIDPWEDPGDHAYRGFMEVCGHFPNLRPVRGYSPAVADQIPGDVDMVFIDGDHSRESLEADIDVWLPRTRKLICGHDYSEIGGYPDVKPVVDERFGSKVVLPERTSIWTVWL